MRNRIDEIFRSRLANREEQYSKELWSNIEAELFPKKSNRYAGLWLFALGVLFLLPIYILKDLNSKTNLKPAVAEANEHLTNFENSIKNNSTVQNIFSDPINSNTTLSADDLNQEIDSESLDILQKNQTPNKADLNQSIIELNTVLVDPPFVTDNSNPTKNNEHSKFDNVGNVSAGLINTKSGVSLPSTNSNNVFRIITNSASKKNKNLLGTYSNVRYSENQTQLDKISTLPLLIHNFDSDKIELNITTDFCDDRKLNPNKYYSEIYAGIGSTQKSYNINDNQFSDYKILRESTESSKISYNAGFTVGYQFINDFLVEGGFEYSQYNFGLEFKDPNSIMTTTNITIDTIITAEMDTIVQTDTTTVETFNLLNRSLKHQTLEIPLLVGMEFDINNKFSLAFKTGVSFNIYSQSSGFMLDSEGVAINIGSDGASSENEFFKSSFGIAIPFRAQLYFKATPEIDLFVKGGIKYYPSTISVSDFAIKDKIVYNNIGLGLRVQI